MLLINDQLIIDISVIKKNNLGHKLLYSSSVIECLHQHHNAFNVGRFRARTEDKVQQERKKR